jgi:hypothetical protein
VDTQGQDGVRLGTEQWVCGASDVVVTREGMEHEGWFREDTEVIDFLRLRATTSYSAATAYMSEG